MHELFHVVQNGYHSDAPETGALTEGMADYARARFGTDDPLWALEPYTDGQSYMDSYRVTGAFLRYVADTWGERVLIRLNRLLHEGYYSADFWTDCTGKTLDALWSEYASVRR